MNAENDTGRAASRHRPGEASAPETGVGVLAWTVLRQVEEYRAAWRRHAAEAGVSAALEPGPFPIRAQSVADLEAERFEMLCWQDPFTEDGPASSFWRQEGMPEGVLEPGAEPLLRLMGEDASVEGLRLLGGDLVLKIECGGGAVQVRLENVARFPDDGGVSIKHPFGLRVPLSVRRLLDAKANSSHPDQPDHLLRLAANPDVNLKQASASWISNTIAFGLTLGS